MAQHVERDFDLLCDKKNNSPHARNNYCFTWNNYTPELEGQFRSWLEFNCKYAIYGHEIAPVTGTPHLQGFFSLKTKKRMTTLQKRFGENHIKLALFVAKGSAQQNRAYCTKADKENYFEHGEWLDNIQYALLDREFLGPQASSLLRKGRLEARDTADSEICATAACVGKGLLHAAIIP